MSVCFLHYDSRSGSTFLAQKLTENFGAFSPPEVNFIPRLCKAYAAGSYSEFKGIICSDPKHRDWNIPPSVLSSLSSSRFDSFYCLLRSLLASFLKDSDENQIIIKKNYVRFVRDIDAAIPDARHIFLIRDGRAVFGSKKKSIKSTTGKPFTESVIRAAFQWKKFVNGALDLNRALPDRSLVCFYEKIILEESALAEVARWIGLTEARDKVGYVLPERYSYGLHENIFKPADASRLEKWRVDLSRTEIQLYDALCGRLLEKLGYSPVDGVFRVGFAITDLFRWLYELLRYRARA